MLLRNLVRLCRNVSTKSCAPVPNCFYEILCACVVMFLCHLVRRCPSFYEILCTCVVMFLCNLVRVFPRLFTIYKQKPVGARFVQMVSKNSRMGNLVGIGVYHLQNPFKVTERVWREAKSWEYANGKHGFRLEIPFWNFGLPFKKSRFLRKFSVWEDQNRLTIYIPTEISWFLW